MTSYIPTCCITLFLNLSKIEEIMTKIYPLLFLLVQLTMSRQVICYFLKK